MSRFWYYAEGDKSVGPISLPDIVAILSRVSNAGSVLVWRDGFSAWVNAESVPELAVHLVKPPPLIPSHSKQAPITALSLPAVRGEVPVRDEASKANSYVLVGIGGWLILVAIGQVLGPLKFLASLFNYYSNLESALWTNFPVLMYGEAALNMSVLAIICYTSYLFFTKSRLFPPFFVYEYAAIILLYPLDVIFSTATVNAYTGQSIEELTAKMMTPGVVGQWIAAFVFAAIWIPYIKLSKRVANTFGGHTRVPITAAMTTGGR